MALQPDQRAGCLAVGARWWERCQRRCFGYWFVLGRGQWHPDLADNVITGFDAVDGDEFPVDPGNSVGGSVYHGTHVSGTVAAAVNGSGGAGVAFGSRLMPVRVLGEGDWNAQ